MDVTGLTSMRCLWVCNFRPFRPKPDCAVAPSPRPEVKKKLGFRLCLFFVEKCSVLTRNVSIMLMFCGEEYFLRFYDPCSRGATVCATERRDALRRA